MRMIKKRSTHQRSKRTEKSRFAFGSIRLILYSTRFDSIYFFKFEIRFDPIRSVLYPILFDSIHSIAGSIRSDSTQFDSYVRALLYWKKISTRKKHNEHKCNLIEKDSHALIDNRSTSVCKRSVSGGRRTKIQAVITDHYCFPLSGEKEYCLLSMDLNLIAVG